MPGMTFSLWLEGGFNSLQIVCFSVRNSSALYMSTLHMVSCLSQNKANEEMSKLSEKSPTGSSATLPAPTVDDSFGTRKGRSSFGKGFFKLRGGKRTTSTPNLGKTLQLWPHLRRPWMDVYHLMLDLIYGLFVFCWETFSFSTFVYE